MGSTVLRGIAASQGQVEGVAKIINTGDDVISFPDGAVLVTKLTDPTMVQAMIKAVAIVTDIGGLTSHPAILSREMGIPCVVNTREATSVITDGRRIRVDGTRGEVHVLD